MFKKLTLVFMIFGCKNILSSQHAVLFSGRNSLKSAFLNLIYHATNSVKVSMYLLTEKDVMRGLMDAKARDVDVQLILDHESMHPIYGKGLLLEKYGIPVHVYRNGLLKGCGSAGNRSLMHNKIGIFDNEIAWTGSWNATNPASSIHQENALITDDAYIVAQYQACFASLLNLIKNQNVLEMKNKNEMNDCLIKKVEIEKERQKKMKEVWKKEQGELQSHCTGLQPKI